MFSIKLSYIITKKIATSFSAGFQQSNITQQIWNLKLLNIFLIHRELHIIQLSV